MLIISLIWIKETRWKMRFSLILNRPYKKDGKMDISYFFYLIKTLPKWKSNKFESFFSLFNSLILPLSFINGKKLAGGKIMGHPGELIPEESFYEDMSTG